MGQPSIKKNFLYSSILTTANYIFPMLTFPYLTRVLGPTNIGICNFVDSIIHYFLIISMLGIGTVGVREIAKAKNCPEKLSSVFSSLLVINLFSTIIALSTLFVCVFCIPKFHDYQGMMWIGATKILFNSLLIEWFFKGIENFKYITNRSIAVRFLYVLSVFLFVKDQSDYGIYYFLLTLLTVVNSLFNLIYSRKFVKFSFKNLNLRPFVEPMIIMGLYGILTSMYTTFNTMYLGLVAGDTEVGYYSTATKLYNIFIALFSAFTGVMLPRMSYILSEGKIEEFKHLLSRSVSVLFSFSTPLVFYTIVYAPEIIRIVAGAGFENSILPMQICMPLLLVIGYEQIIIVQGLMALDKNKAVFVNSVLGAIVGVFCCLLLVEPLKSTGASISWCISELVVLLSASFFINKYVGIKFPIKQLINTVVYHLPLFFILILLHQKCFATWWSLMISVTFTLIYVVLIQIFVIKDPLVIFFLTKIKFLK